MKFIVIIYIYVCVCVQNLPPEFQKLVLRPFVGFNLRAPLVAFLASPKAFWTSYSGLIHGLP